MMCDTELGGIPQALDVMRSGFWDVPTSLQILLHHWPKKFSNFMIEPFFLILISRNSCVLDDDTNYIIFA
jgi:hypothetical protein